MDRLFFSFPLPDLTRHVSPEFIRGRWAAIYYLSKRQIVFDPRFIGLIQYRGLRQLPFALPAFRNQQVTLPRLAP
jgi:hypothetical protein